MARNGKKSVVWGDDVNPELPKEIDTTTAYSDAFRLTEGNHGSVHMTWSAGNLTAQLWLSNKDNPGTADDTDWCQDTSIEDLPDASSDGKYFASIGNLDAEWGRWKLTTSATANVWVAQRHLKEG